MIVTGTFRIKQGNIPVIIAIATFKMATNIAIIKSVINFAIAY